MISLNKLRTIAKAKFSNKSNLGDWYKKRIEICSQCPLNSVNKKELSAKDIAMVGFNLGKPTCLACGCEIAAKASVKEEYCGLKKINQVPLWEAIVETEKSTFKEYEIENLTPNVVKMSIEDNIILDYGTIRKGSPSTIQISIKDIENLTTQLNATSSCGCTVPAASKSGDTYFVSITYDSRRVGTINKDVVFRVVRNNQHLIFKANLTGTVK